MRAMFDRIAGVYDRHELRHDGRACTTAGARARPTSRRVGPGDAALDVATGTGDLALELAAARRRRRGRRRDFSEEMLERARAKAPRDRAGSGRNALDAALRGRPSSPPRRSASARATSPTSSAGVAEMARVVRPGGRVVILEITTPAEAAAVDVLLASGSTASCRRSGGSPATPMPTRTCRTR